MFLLLSNVMIVVEKSLFVFFWIVLFSWNFIICSLSKDTCFYWVFFNPRLENNDTWRIGLFFKIVIQTEF